MNPQPISQFPLMFDLGGGLRLRAAEPDDAETVYAAVDRNRDHLRAWLPWVDGSQSVRDTRIFLEQDAEQRVRGVTATYLILDDGALAGFVGLHDIDQVNRSFLIGYWLDKRSEGLGLITQACRYLVKTAFEQFGMERAVIRCAMGNTRSAAVPKRLGFVLEGLERHGQRLNGEFVDLERYSLLSDDWLQP